MHSSIRGLSPQAGGFRRRSNRPSNVSRATGLAHDPHERLPCVQQVLTRHLLFRIILQYAAVFQPRVLFLFRGPRNILPTDPRDPLRPGRESGEVEALRGHRRPQRQARKGQGVLGCRRGRQARVGDEAVEALQTRHDQLGRAADSEVSAKSTPQPNRRSWSGQSNPCGESPEGRSGRTSLTRGLPRRRG